jgi:hypothetical protein
VKKLLMSRYYIIIQILLFPFFILGKFLSLFFKKAEEQEGEENEESEEKEEKPIEFYKNKINKSGYNTSMHIIHA